MELFEAELRSANEIGRADRLQQAALVVGPVAADALQIRGAIGIGFEDIDRVETDLFLSELRVARQLGHGAQAAIDLEYTGSNALELEITVSLYSYFGPSQVKLLLPKFHRNRTRKYYNTALFVGGCWVSLTGRFHRHSAAGWAECTVAGPGRVRRL